MGHDGRDAAQGHGGERAGEARTQRVPGKRRVQTDAQDNAVHLLRHTNDADYEHRPRDDRRAVRVCGERGQHQLDEHQVEHHEYAHAGEHPQPAAEDIARAFRPAHRKGQRRAVRQDTEDNVPLRDLEEQPDKLPLDDDVYHDDDEPARVGERIKGFLPKRVKGDGVRHLQHLHDRGGQAKADIADLPAGEQQKGKHRAAQEQPPRLLRLDADA